MLTLLTATGARQQAWAICEQLMMRQTYTGPVHWIIVDDGEEAQPITFEHDNWTLTIVRPEPFWKPGQNTQARNLLAGIKRVKPNDRLVIIEDDDAYAPDYIETVDRWLDTHDLVGESHARYYNIASQRYQQLRNSNHASLCSTAIKGGYAIDAFERELKPGVQFIDINLWRNFKGSKALHRSNMVVGIKGQPGRGGIGMGHKPDFAENKDSTGVILRQWLGINASFYNV